VEYLQTQTGAIHRIVRFVTRFRLQNQGLRTGLTVPPGVCGPGFSIAHHGTLVINTRAQIGKYCRIHPCTTIGIAKGGVPSIGDFVYIGPGAVLYGDITIGDYSVIGANAVVRSDVPAGVTVAGAPASLVATDSSRNVMPGFIVELMPDNELNQQ
jgi:serine O-acetyltransferase